MTKHRPWEGIVPPEELETYRQAGFGSPVGLGSRPALLVIDTQYRSLGTEPAKPINEAIKQYPTACGTLGWRAVPHIADCIAAFRNRGFPVIYAYVAPKQAYDRSQFARKAPGVMGIDAKGYEFVSELSPQEGDILLPKHQASAFAGTALLSYLIKFGVDSLAFSGCTTSGCVRASVVDAAALNYRCVVPEDAVYDRSPTSHAVNLFDMASKYADVMPAAELVGLIGALK